MVTTARPERLPLIEQSLRAFCQQSHDHRQLVIVLDDPAPGDRQQLERALADLPGVNVQLVVPPGKRSLGALRNASLAAAAGEILCQWDDDDLHHPYRVEAQLELLLRSGAGAVLLQNCLHLFQQVGGGFVVNWGKTRYRGHPATLMMRAGHGLLYPEEGPCARAGEDTDLLVRLAQAVPVEFLAASPALYGYRFHGRNTFGLQHHLTLARRFCEPRDRVREMQLHLLQGMRELELDPQRLQLVDGDGPFSLAFPAAA
jgi:glycosyltransferase involved in cell wall biosynthesis